MLCKHDHCQIIINSKNNKQYVGLLIIFLSTYSLLKYKKNYRYSKDFIFMYINIF